MRSDEVFKRCIPFNDFAKACAFGLMALTSSPENTPLVKGLTIKDSVKLPSFIQNAQMEAQNTFEHNSKKFKRDGIALIASKLVMEHQPLLLKAEEVGPRRFVVGYGNLIRAWRPLQINKTQAEELLADDMKVLSCIIETLDADFSKNERAGLCVLLFFSGESVLERGETVHLLERDHPQRTAIFDVAPEWPFRKADNEKEDAARRAAALKLFLTSEEDADTADTCKIIKPKRWAARLVRKEAIRLVQLALAAANN